MNKTFLLRQKMSEQGFTLVETLVAISIFIVVIVGPISIAAKSMQSAYYASEQTTAIFLAQESLESIRRLRDNSGLAAYQSSNADDDSWEWFDDLKTECKSTSGTRGCDLDRLTNAEPQEYKSCPTNGEGCVLRRFKGSGSHPGFLYGYGSGGGSWEDSPYKRKIVVEDRGDAVAVTVTVSWNSNLFGGTNRSVVLQSWIYDQYRRYDD